jgi:plastocyanin
MISGMMPPAMAADIHIRVVNQVGAPLENAVVFLKSDALISQARSFHGVEMAQRDREFVPGLRIVTRGSSVEFPNQDDVRHHVYSFSPAKTFELKLYIGKPKAPVVFDQEGIVELGCNIHDTMIGWILVTDTPVYAKTDAQGEVVFSDQVKDDYEIAVWHRSFPYGEPYQTHAFRLSEDDAAHAVTLSVGGEPF